MPVEVEEVKAETVDTESMVMLSVVKVKDDNGKLWKDAAEIISVSQTGAGFYMKRECKPGRLMMMMLPVEAELRLYDHDKELYRVWGLVQHCHRLSDEDVGYHVGVAFIGPGKL